MKQDKPKKQSKQSNTSVGSHFKKQTVFFFKPDIKLALIPAIIGFLLYANSIANGYVLDDEGMIQHNQYVQQGLSGIVNIFKSDVWHFENGGLGYYRPLSLATFAIEHQLFPQNPHVTHLVNVVLFALTGFFLCYLLMQVFSNYHPVFACIATVLFMAHPIHTEVVANIKSRDEILSLLNVLISLNLLFRVWQQQKINFIWIGFSAFFLYLGLLSKETALVAFILAPLVMYFSARFDIKQMAMVTGVCLAIVLVFQFQKYEAIGTVSGKEMKDLISFPYTATEVKVPTMFLLFAWSVKLAVIPYPLAYSYAYNQIPATGWGAIGPVLGFILAMGILYTAYKYFRERSPLAFAALFFLVTILPAMGFVVLKGGILAERFLYAPVLGWCIALVWLTGKVFNIPLQAQDMIPAELLKQYKFSAPIGVLLILFGGETVARNTDWHDNMSLVSHDVEVVPESCEVHLHYGTQLIEQGVTAKSADERNGYFNKAYIQLNQAVYINPQIAQAYYEIGRGFQLIKQNNDSAIYYYNQAILQGADYPLSYFALGTIYEKTGKQDFASYYYNTGARLYPYFTPGIATRDRHRKQTGLDVKDPPFQNNMDSLELTTVKKDFSFYSNMGQVYGKRGDYVNALRCLEMAVEMNPASEEALINLSLCQAMTRKYDRSIETLNRALSINPNNTLALQNLAIIYDHVGNRQKAEACRDKLKSLTGK